MTEQNHRWQNAASGRRKVFATRAEADAVKPAGAEVRLFEVLKDGQSRGFAWGLGGYEALIAAARHDGYAARVADPRGRAPLTKGNVAAELAEFTDEKLAATGLARKKGRK